MKLRILTTDYRHVKCAARPYQVKPSRAAIKAWNDGHRSILIKMATGLGKTHNEPQPIYPADIS